MDKTNGVMINDTNKLSNIKSPLLYAILKKYDNAANKKIFTALINKNFFMPYDNFFIKNNPNAPSTIFAAHIPSSGLSNALSANFSPPTSDAQ